MLLTAVCGTAGPGAAALTALLAGQLQLLVFEPACENFRLMEAPPARRGEEDLARTRICVLSGGQLCTVAVARATSTMDMWVLDEYSGAWTWRLMERISLVM
ncbi:hypothetical protein E2562_012312 [Oryza meyeriana var. granulata]|uniref:F-box associated domain-containing protein n=1 Tax=Oryza meyeriana var. granulata TaxID=110450 RepID=A0A6G1DHY4_9ORYZ|nr:hypothetical protein E2562_012312 [Oryza meyeriana var. granulata]